MCMLMMMMMELPRAGGVYVCVYYSRGNARGVHTSIKNLDQRKTLIRNAVVVLLFFRLDSGLDLRTSFAH